MRTPKRRTAPPTQRRPSPNTTPAPPFTGAVPWKKSIEAVAGTPWQASHTSSELTLAVPKAKSDAPSDVAELAQPRPLVPKLPQGQAAALPSPAHNVWA